MRGERHQQSRKQKNRRHGRVAVVLQLLVLLLLAAVIMCLLCCVCVRCATDCAVCRALNRIHATYVRLRAYQVRRIRYTSVRVLVYTGGKKYQGMKKKEADDDPFMVTEFTPPVNPCSTAVLYIGTAQ